MRWLMNKEKQLGSYSPQLLDEVSIWFVPMINPDGVSIQQGNLSVYPLQRSWLFGR